MEELTVKLVETEEEMEGALGVRFRVFVAEQHVPMDEELDEFDSVATHAIVSHRGEIVATGRIVYGNEDSAARIGRIAVDVEWRPHWPCGWRFCFLPTKNFPPRGATPPLPTPGTP